MAAAVAAAAQDYEDDQQWCQTGGLGTNGEQGWSNGVPAGQGSRALSSFVVSRPGSFAGGGAASTQPVRDLRGPSALRLGSTVTAASVTAAKAEALRQRQKLNEGGTSGQSQGGTAGSLAGGSRGGVVQPCPTISGKHATTMTIFTVAGGTSFFEFWMHHQAIFIRQMILQVLGSDSGFAVAV